MNLPTLSRLAAYQKRLHDWRDFNDTEVHDLAIKTETTKLISALSDLLFKCWENSVITNEDDYAIRNLERQLEQLNEEARLHTAAKKVSQISAR